MSDEPAPRDNSEEGGEGVKDIDEKLWYATPVPKRRIFTGNWNYDPTIWSGFRKGFGRRKSLTTTSAIITSILSATSHFFDLVRDCYGVKDFYEDGELFFFTVGVFLMALPKFLKVFEVCYYVRKWNNIYAALWETFLILSQFNIFVELRTSIEKKRETRKFVDVMMQEQIYELFGMIGLYTINMIKSPHNILYTFNLITHVAQWIVSLSAKFDPLKGGPYRPLLCGKDVLIGSPRRFSMLLSTLYHSCDLIQRQCVFLSFYFFYYEFSILIFSVLIGIYTLFQLACSAYAFSIKGFVDVCETWKCTRALLTLFSSSDLHAALILYQFIWNLLWSIILTSILAFFLDDNSHVTHTVRYTLFIMAVSSNFILFILYCHYLPGQVVDMLTKAGKSIKGDCCAKFEDRVFDFFKIDRNTHDFFERNYGLERICNCNEVNKEEAKVEIYLEGKLIGEASQEYDDKGLIVYIKKFRLYDACDDSTVKYVFRKLHLFLLDQFVSVDMFMMPDLIDEDIKTLLLRRMRYSSEEEGSMLLCSTDDVINDLMSSSSDEFQREGYEYSLYYKNHSHQNDGVEDEEASSSSNEPTNGINVVKYIKYYEPTLKCNFAEYKWTAQENGATKSLTITDFKFHAFEDDDGIDHIDRRQFLMEKVVHRVRVLHRVEKFTLKLNEVSNTMSTKRIFDALGFTRMIKLTDVWESPPVPKNCINMNSRSLATIEMRLAPS